RSGECDRGRLQAAGKRQALADQRPHPSEGPAHSRCRWGHADLAGRPRRQRTGSSYASPTRATRRIHAGAEVRPEAEGEAVEGRRQRLPRTQERSQVMGTTWDELARWIQPLRQRVANLVVRGVVSLVSDQKK